MKLNLSGAKTKKTKAENFEKIGTNPLSSSREKSTLPIRGTKDKLMISEWGYMETSFANIPLGQESESLYPCYSATLFALTLGAV